MTNHPAYAKFKQEYFPLLFLVTLQWWVYCQIPFGGPLFTLISNISGAILTILAFSFAYLAYPYVTMQFPHKDILTKVSFVINGIIFHIMFFYVWYVDFHRVSDIVYLAFYAYLMMFFILFYNAMHRIPDES